MIKRLTSLPGLFVVGTDTGVGKTFVASSIARTWSSLGRRVGVLKPVGSGAEIREGRPWTSDASALIDAIGGGVSQENVCPIVFSAPLAPSVAARLEGVLLEPAEVVLRVVQVLEWWTERAEVMVVEGTGGLLCPIAEGMTVADLAMTLDYPLLIVARRSLGTLNHTLLTVEAAASRGLRIAGVLLNGAVPSTDPRCEATNIDELSRRLGGVALLGEWEHHGIEGVEAVAPEAGGWYDLARMSRRFSERF